MLPFSVQLERGKPKDEQILAAVREAMASGQLRDGDPFPSAKTLTQELRISPLAAQKTIAKLREQGFLAQQSGSGLTVRSSRGGDRAARQDIPIEDQPTVVTTQPDLGKPFPFLASSDDPGILGMLDGFEIRRLIARGGMGLVFEAFDRGLHRSVAIKVLAPEIAVSENSRTRFLREARAVAAIDHEHVLPVHTVGEATGALPFLVMPLVGGDSLQTLIDEEEQLPVPELLRIATGVARGLAAAHTHGLVHRDIKPANILLERKPGSRVWIVDFGLARAAEGGDLTQSGALAGTPRFASPEQAAGGEIDHRSDLFSFGSTLHAMALGEPPFCGSTLIAVLRSIADDVPPPLRESRADIPEELEALVLSLLAKEPKDRPASATEVADRLAELAAGQG